MKNSYRLCRRIRFRVNSTNIKRIWGNCDNRGINRCSLLSVNLWTNRLLAAAAQTDPCIYVSYVLTAWIVWGRVRLIPAIFSWESTQKVEFKNDIITTINLIPQNNWKIWSMYVLFFFICPLFVLLHTFFFIFYIFWYS